MSSSLLLDALEDLAGPVILADANLGVQISTRAADLILGETVAVGTPIPKLLCGDAVERPIAEALSQGRPVVGVVSRLRAGEEVSIRVRATPIEREGELRGWMLLLDDDRAVAPDGPVRFHGLWTQDARMKHVFEVLSKAARRESSILIRGETGTGKELVAQAIHALSPRREGPFRAINCAALPPSLLESELFGHIRGAFTGAVRDNLGHFRSAEGGTLLLDEVAEMPMEVQAKLLRVLETKTVIPVGGSEPIAVDVRIVAATHTGLRKAVEEGRFRADLMYRLRVVPIFIPPLRDRPGDLSLLIEKLLEGLSEDGERRIERISPGAKLLLERHPWPGNVRELRNVLEYALVMGEGPVLLESDLPPELLDGEDALESGVVVNRPSQEPPAAEGDSEEERRIRRALERASGNRERAARMLGMSRVTLWRRMKQLGLEEG